MDGRKRPRYLSLLAECGWTAGNGERRLRLGGVFHSAVESLVVQPGEHALKVNHENLTGLVASCFRR